MAGSSPRVTACPKPSNLLGDKTSPGEEKQKSHTKTTLLPPPLLMLFFMWEVGQATIDITSELKFSIIPQ